MKVLVPLDGSRRAMEALPVAQRLTRENDVVILLTVGDVPDTALHAKEIHGELSHMLRSASEQLHGRAVDTRVELTGDPEGTIADAAREESVELIVMTTSCSAPIARFARRSVPDRVLRRARIPVTFVPVARDNRVTAPDW